MTDRQRGFTLISLMVGTVISMVGILALMFLYKDMVQTSVAALGNAKQDGQIASAQLTILKELQTAGFGVVDAKASGDDTADRSILLLSGASLGNGNTLGGSLETVQVIPMTTLTGDREGNALIWSYYETTGGVLKCAGLLVQQDSPGDPFRLYRLQSTGNCTEKLSFTSITWSKTMLIAEGQTVPNVGEAKLWPFAARLTTCWPFGKRSDSNTADYPQISVRTRASTIDSSGEPLITNTTVCLPNFSK
ncbi:prepilin-type N-terminal cleavage/methylation domain-containing protein [Pseudomonas putida]|uniref:PilW family protein n=1 Tax=Pseudomonas putida TaxID=303 RepID=UPI002363348A|nr:prepilin-type N-terminal cleavage/methylation domain-containing protein [Pseudomonas putida]MDD2051582.1 prepilin-type N-terminal cleavage/methylation domain-containing protein [Pseudomonas putida]